MEGTLPFFRVLVCLLVRFSKSLKSNSRVCAYVYNKQRLRKNTRTSRFFMSCAASREDSTDRAVTQGQPPRRKGVLGCRCDAQL